MLTLDKDQKKIKLKFLELKKSHKKYYYTLIFTKSQNPSLYVMRIIHKSMSEKESHYGIYNNILCGFSSFLEMEEKYKTVLTANYGFAFGDIL